MAQLTVPVTILKHGVWCTFVSDGDGCALNFVTNHFATWEPRTFEMFELCANSEKVAIDIGAWIGATGIWLSQRFRHVVLVEADPVSVEAMEANLSASGCREFSIVRQPIAGSRQLVYFGPHRRGGGLNESISQAKRFRTSPLDLKMPSVTLADVFNKTSIRPNEVGLIKVDIEGGEESILEDLFAFGKGNPECKLLVSFHVSWWSDTNVARFQHLLDATRVISPILSSIENMKPATVSALLQCDPFASVLFAFDQAVTPSLNILCNPLAK